MTEPTEKPELFLPKTTMFFTGISVLLILAIIALFIVGGLLLLELHWLGSGYAGD